MTDSQEKSDTEIVPQDNDIATEEAQQEKIKYPKSVFFIISNEFCERFSYYGMRTILSLYLRDILRFTEGDSKIVYHLFNMLCYFFPLIGAIISDSWLGKFRTILYVSIIYAIGNVLLALASTAPIGLPQAPFSLLGLFFIAVGTGGIKPCVSAFGGDQFVVPQQEKELSAFFSVFYFSINSGSLITTFLSPVLRQDVHCFDEDTCYPLAFAIPGILMIVSIIIFFLGMPLYKILKPEGNIVVKVVKCMWYGFRQKSKSKEKKEHWLDHAASQYDQSLIEDIKATLKVLVVFSPLPIFWALYDQQGSAWTFQATRMDGRLGSAIILPDQMQVVNPILILMFIPFFTYVVYPFCDKFNFINTPLKKMVVGGFLAAVAFGISAGVSAALEATYPELPSAGSCQFRIYNPYDCKGTIKIDQFLEMTEVGPMGYVHKDVKCGTKNVTYVFNHCLVADGAGTVEIKDGTGYFIYPTLSDGVLILEDDISKPEDGLPKVRTLISNPGTFNFTYSGDDSSLTAAGNNNTLFSLEPGTYKFGSQNFEFNLGGVYTVLAELENDQVKTSKLFEVTEANSIHILVQIPQLLIITAAEILFAITGIEFSYSQAPVSMKSVLSASFLLTTAIGNLIIVIIESVQIFERQSLDFTLYTGLMILDMLAFMYVASKYKYPKREAGDPNDKSVKE